MYVLIYTVSCDGRKIYNDTCVLLPGSKTILNYRRQFLRQIDARFNLLCATSDVRLTNQTSTTYSGVK